MTNPDNSKADWSNYWQGRTAAPRGEALTGVGIENSEELSAFWRDVFAGVERATILDLACGPGSAIRHASASSENQLLGLDISFGAIQSTSATVPGFMGVVASADRIPFADASIDLVVSQFGFEYADGQRAAADISRILRPGGAFHAITHLKSGVIAEECRARRSGLKDIEDSGYIDAARALFTCVFAHERAPSEASMRAVEEASRTFAAAQQTMMPQIRAGGLAGHLHSGASQLYERRRAYLLEDVLGWIDGMVAEIHAFIGRMDSMLDAAIDETEARQLLNVIAPSGQHDCTAFQLDGRPAALALTARR